MTALQTAPALPRTHSRPDTTVALRARDLVFHDMVACGYEPDDLTGLRLVTNRKEGVILTMPEVEWNWPIRVVFELEKEFENLGLTAIPREPDVLLLRVKQGL